MIIPFKSASKMAPFIKDSTHTTSRMIRVCKTPHVEDGKKKKTKSRLFLSSVVSVVVVSSTFDDNLSLSFRVRSARERTPIYIEVFTFRERKSLDPKPPGNVEYSRLWPNEVPRDGPRACRTQPRHRSSPHFVYVSIDDGVSTNRWSLLLRRRREVVRCRAPDAREKEEAEDVRAVAQRPRENRGFERLVDRRHVRWRRRLCV